MNQQRKTLSTLVAGMMLAGGTICFGQADTGSQPRVRDTLPAAQGAAADRAGAAADKATDKVTGHASAAGHAAVGGQQVDQQVQQQLQKISQQKDNMVGDRLFVLEAGLHNQFEMALAQLAQTKSQDQQVKQLAQRILQDHQQASQQLTQVAQKLQVELPQGLTSMKQQKLQIIGSMESKMFDQKFVACMDELHAHDVTAFRNASQIAQSPDLKQFTTQTLPKLREHHQMVKQSATALGLSSDMEAQPAGGRIPAGGREGVTPSREGTTPPSGTNTPGSGQAPGSGREGATPGSGTGTGTGSTGTGNTGPGGTNR